jgi:hypothetical protein
MISLREESFTENDIIDPTWVIRYLSNHLPKKNINAEKVVEVIKKMCKRIEGVRVVYQRQPKFKDCFAVHGLFDENLKKSIVITLWCASYKKRFTIEDQIYTHLINEVADALCHESIHRYQYNVRDMDRSLDREDFGAEYYADPDEMFAYSVNIAHNLYRQLGPDTLKSLTNFDLITKKDGYVADYYSLFYNQPVFWKLMKMVYQNVLAIEEGKICHRGC